MPANLTPMMSQYLALKEKYSDCLLFFRLGDFYEMFFEDAVTASKVLDIALTGRDCGLESLRQKNWNSHLQAVTAVRTNVRRCAAFRFMR